MARIVLELTNRCNLRCQHCFSGRHGGRDDLPLELLQDVLDEAKTHGFDHLTFTGGDPTIHPHFTEVLRRTFEAGYEFSFVTNGYNFATTYPKLLPYRDALSQITFSLDGATEETHDRLRGRGSYRKVLGAMSVCTALGIPFSNNMVVTGHNRHELAQMAALATSLGSRGLRFGHLMPSPLTTAQNFDLSPKERKEVEAEIWALRDAHALPIAMAPGHHTTSLFPCAPLHLQEINIDCKGFLTKCCHLSSHGEGVGDGDVAGDLRHVSFKEALGRLEAANKAFHAAKMARLKGGLEDADFFPCWYCSNAFKKVDWLDAFSNNPWTPLRWNAPEDAPETVSQDAALPS